MGGGGVIGGGAEECGQGHPIWYKGPTQVKL